MRTMRRYWMLTLVLGFGFSTQAFSFPWKKITPVVYVPPYYGYYPTQWREFPPCDDQGVIVTTPAAPAKPDSNVPTETLPEPKKSLTSTSAARGASPQPYIPQPITLSGLPAPDPVQQVVTPKNPEVFPASRPEKRFHSFNEAGHFTSACAALIYRDELLFGGDATRHAFTCEPFHNLVQHNLVSDDGVSFSSRRASQVRASV